MKLKNKISLITGAGRGIGELISKKLASEGSEVILVSRTQNEIKSVLNEIKKNNGNGSAFTCDISNISEVKNLVVKIFDNYSQIDILINNAGIIEPIGPLVKQDPILWKTCVENNLFGTFNMIHSVLPFMIKKNYGKIVNISGGGAFSPFPNFSSYATSKAAIIRLTETLAMEISNSNITVNAISPGMIKTNMTKKVVDTGLDAGNEFEKAKKTLISGSSNIEKILDALLFLTTDESSKLSGKTIAAQWDNLDDIKNNISSIQNSDKLTMRRIV
tara:strand:+ start:723 stop:1544 length:822 start_codon:yes stop_codon:yes gene_type:complete